ncbi:MAG: HetP family heterocyst commitment protein [Cyanothece sp. SIO1E1]|nr:HetP family heterocyst commitment protein [Cyanothece sp. SIO1E1]
MNSFDDNNLNKLKAMSTEELNQILDAILMGKYSWACVLMLRFADFDPLSYVPYRTYARILKENRQNNVSKLSISSRNDLARSRVKA